MYLYPSSTPGTQHAPSAHFPRSLRPFSTSALYSRNPEWRETPNSPDHLGLFSSSCTRAYLVLHKQIVSQILPPKRPEKAHFFAVRYFYTKPPPRSPFYRDTRALASGCTSVGAQPPLYRRRLACILSSSEGGPPRARVRRPAATNAPGTRPTPCHSARPEKPVPLQYLSVMTLVIRTAPV